MANEFANVDYREKIKKLTLFDAILFRKAFDLNIPAAAITHSLEICYTKCYT